MATTTDEGMSTSKKVVAGAAIGVAIPAAVGAAKKLMGSGESSTRASKSRSKTSKGRSTTGATRSSAKARSTKRATAAKSRSTTKRSTTSARSKAASSRSGSTRSTKLPTREQLYRQATRLKIEGRSRMTKAQLQRAVTRARTRTRA